ncbi:MAG: rhodanese-like domain-containing protein [Xanthobacteraceae bacterium]
MSLLSPAELMTDRLLRPIAPHALKAMLADGGELALIDLREELVFSQRHLLLARSLPLSRLELKFAQLVPRRSTRIVLCDDGEGLIERAARVLADAGYQDLQFLEGGVTGWERAGFLLFSGVNVPSKAFGELVEHKSQTPSLDAADLDQLIRSKADLVVLDSRPFDEYRRVSIPSAVNVPGAELVLRVRDLAPSSDTLVVVNCAGRTRSIIGAQSLINAGVPNKVMALRNGTMGWSLAGLSCEHGQSRRAPPPSGAAREWAGQAAAQAAERSGVACIDRATLARWQSEREERTLYLFDVRDPEEYALGHVAGAVSAPGGQLVQATDQYIGTLCSRIVLVDDVGARAFMTASWLRQMGWNEVAVLIAAGDETGFPVAPVLGPPADEQLAMNPSELGALLAHDMATVVDLSLSRDYLAAHIQGAWFAIRSRLAQGLASIAPRGTLVLTSEDGVLAAMAARETQALTACPVRFLAGGNRGWQAAGHPLVRDERRMADEAIDAWLKPYERGNASSKAMREYLAWEVDLLDRVARDGSLAFTPLPA